ncbi:hypothetical protein [Actinomadura kijaniata]|uniref:hypothetical protein n=1 Tax=Actinomadura kijaniata TaxID=46161 RepID=UPI00082CDF14|nr:hypothetical protein [Actinomadura kijaniata]
MAETWSFDGTASVTPDTAVHGIRARIAEGRLETWLHSSAGRALAFVTNAERAMVMLVDEPGDPGGHATSPGAEGRSGGFVLANGQADEYPDADTVPLAEAFRIVRHAIAHGSPPPDAAWAADR